MGVSVFHHPAFVWACAAFAAACLVAAVAVGARAFWSELAAKFLRLPAAGKAAFVAFVAVATAVAQKPGDVSTNLHESTRIATGESLEEGNFEGGLALPEDWKWETEEFAGVRERRLLRTE